jgi:transcriptional regulator with XRE-family HTH domain
MDRPLRQILGERIHLTRRRAGLSQVELAARADISPTTLNRVELGRQKLYAETLVTLAQILGVSVDYLVGMTNDDRPRTQQDRQQDENTLSPQPTRQRTRKAAPTA